MLNYFASIADAGVEQGAGHQSYALLTERNGCVNGCCCGISRYADTAYGAPGCHADQEGFVVLSGEGIARIGEQESALHKGIAFIAPAGVPHAIRSASPDTPVEVFWFHAAI